jgi:large subunit ribosomal protein L13
MIFTVRGPGSSSFPAVDHSSILLLWWNPRAALEPRLFLPQHAPPHLGSGAGPQQAREDVLTGVGPTYYHLRLCEIESDPDFLMKTYSAKPQDVTRDWYVVDASDKVLGRLASAIAHRLRGKHKPIYTPHIDTGDFIVVTNVEKLKVTGNKAEDKLYHRHSGYPGGVRTVSFAKLQQRFPGRVLEKAVKGMLPKGPLGYAMLKKLKCYAGPAHPHTAQQPKTLDL